MSEFDTIVVGGGVGGSIVAGRLAGESDQSVLLLEAGPDFGPFGSSRWPEPLLDYRSMPVDIHQWHYASQARHGTPGLALDRARVIGGCSSHNGCAALWGHRADYDAWAALGLDGWDAESLVPLFERVNRRFRVFTPSRDNVTPWHQACLSAGPAAGFPLLEDLHDLDADLGIGRGALNVAEGVRWNAAFAYLDPARGRDNLTIVGDALVDRLLLQHDACRGVVAHVAGDVREYRASRVVLAGGAYGSPLVLLRSGIGPAEELDRVGIDVRHDLPGVGKNLQDHPASRVVFEGSAELRRQMRAFADAGGDLREEGTIVLAQSERRDEAFDLHLYPINSRNDDEWIFSIFAALMTPKSTGSIRLSGVDPEFPPVIDHGYFTDECDDDIAVLADGLRLARRLASQKPLASLAGGEIYPGVEGRELPDHIRRNGLHDYHPVGTCKMGLADDRMAVVDLHGKVLGIDGLCVADASVMPVIPRANTNLPTAVVAEHITDGLLSMT